MRETYGQCAKQMMAHVLTRGNSRRRIVTLKTGQKELVPMPDCRTRLATFEGMMVEAADTRVVAREGTSPVVTIITKREN